MKEIISTDRAPEAIGPYSQAVKAKDGEWLFCSGQIPLDPSTGRLVQGPTGVQTRQVMENLKAILTAAGFAMDDVVKTTIYLTDLASFGEVNDVYASFFSGSYPARATVQVAALPRGALVEIDAVAQKSSAQENT